MFLYIERSYRGLIVIYYLGGMLKEYFGPARLLQSYAVLIGLALYTGFILTKVILPKFYKFLPSDRGREFTLTKETPSFSANSFWEINIFFLKSFIPSAYVIGIPHF